MAAGTTFTKTTKFGVGNGPTYEGKTTVPAGDNGNNPDLYDLLVEHGTTVTVDADALPDADLLGGVGFKAILTALNANAGTPAITVKLLGAGPAAADIEIALEDGEAWAESDGAFLTAEWTGISVVGDTTSDFQLQGILLKQYAA